jgi:hypothetical protein
MKKTAQCVIRLTAVLLLAGAVGCSFSHSSGSISDSSGSFSDSSKSSSGEKSAAFRQAVERYTAAFVRGGGRDEASFASGLGDLARAEGVSDWEAAPGVWESIGRGLGDARVDDAEREALADGWAAGDTERRRAIERGWLASR